MGQGTRLGKEGMKDLILIFKKYKPHKVLRLVKFMKTERRMPVARGLEEREIGTCLMGLEFQFCKMKRDRLRNILNVLNTTETCT